MPILYNMFSTTLDSNSKVSVGMDAKNAPAGTFAPNMWLLDVHAMPHVKRYVRYVNMNVATMLTYVTHR